MKITILKKSRSHGLKKYNFSEVQVISILLFVLAVPFLTAFVSYQYAQTSKEQPLSTVAIETMRGQIDQQRQELTETKKRSQLQLDALTIKFGRLQAELTRINAFGQRVASLAKVNKNEFDFSQAPGIGGPEESIGAQENTAAESQMPTTNLFQDLDDFSAQLNDRAYQLEILEAVLLNKEIKAETRISGRPITKGWTSSFYGTRTDPFNGKPAWHGGIDFAGKEGADVIATGTGVVTWAAKRSNYGQFIEISHGDDITTRYAHNSELLVSVGEVVSKGQTIAKMGSEGRSTGPHVHYEILKNGKTLNPEKYVNRH
ncbi:MAG: murein DD-endopeptidase MepM/ murein hydrolase activator NlpD [Enterobacterales bacterium]|jgi:murein DD-endopeptidase MepM/ murein hydrolase activator NlpD